MADAAYYRAYYKEHRESIVKARKKYRTSEKGRAWLESQRLRYRDDEEFREQALERSRKARSRKKEES